MWDRGRVTVRNVLILGGSSGIGLALARLVSVDPAFALRVTAPTAEDAARLKDELPDNVDVHVVDLLRLDDAPLEMVVSELDAVVLSAGVEYVGPAEMEPDGAFEQMLVVNVAGPMAVARACIPAMRMRKRGIIVGLGSVTARQGRPFLAGYSASKAAFESYLAALAGELTGSGIRVECLSLGPVATELGSRGPTNWQPEAGSGYAEGFATARGRADDERSRLLRTADDVAREVYELLG